MPEEVLTLPMVAAMIHVDVRTIRRWVKAKQFPSPVRPGGKGHPRWLKREVDLYLAEKGNMIKFRKLKS